MNWFEALQLCSGKVSSAELFSLLSATEREWLRIELAAFGDRSAGGEQRRSGGKALLWLVSAHLYLCHLDALAWATGRSIDELEYREYAENHCLSPYNSSEELFRHSRRRRGGMLRH